MVFGKVQGRWCIRSEVQRFLQIATILTFLKLWKSDRALRLDDLINFLVFSRCGRIVSKQKKITVF
jgi:hypothetical protein